MDRPLGDGLLASSTADRLDIRLPVDGLGVSFLVEGSRVRVGLQFAISGSGIDVSFQPGAVTHQIHQAARDAGHDPNRWLLLVLKELRAWSGRLDWCPQRADMLGAALGALAYPLLRPVYERGHSALGEIPRWARPVLSECEVMAAARVLDPRASRHLGRALAASLVVGEAPTAPTLEPLAFAVLAAGLVPVDELARVVEVPVPAGERTLPNPQQIDEARNALLLWPDDRRSLLVRDMVRSSSPLECVDLLRRFWWVREQATRPLPIRWEDLVVQCRRLVPVIPGPATGMRGARTDERGLVDASALVADQRPDTRRRQRAAGARRIETPRAAPAVRGHMGDERRMWWPIPDELALAEGLQFDGVSLEVATHAEQLARWGRTLRNCLADFAVSAASGQSWLIGIHHNRTLVGCVEVAPRDRSVRQILGERNRPLPMWLRQAVLEALQTVAAVRA